MSTTKAGRIPHDRETPRCISVDGADANRSDDPERVDLAGVAQQPLCKRRRLDAVALHALSEAPNGVVAEFDNQARHAGQPTTTVSTGAFVCLGPGGAVRPGRFVLCIPPRSCDAFSPVGGGFYPMDVVSVTKWRSGRP